MNGGGFMKRKYFSFMVFLALVFLTMPVVLAEKVTMADYDRAANLRSKLQPLALNIVKPLLVPQISQGRIRV